MIPQKWQALLVNWLQSLRWRPKAKLFCSFCAVIVNHNQRSSVMKHKENAQHLRSNRKKFPDTVSWLWRDLWKEHNLSIKLPLPSCLLTSPLHKLTNGSLKGLFQCMGHTPFSPLCWKRCVESIAKDGCWWSSRASCWKTSVIYCQWSGHKRPKLCRCSSWRHL